MRCAVVCAVQGVCIDGEFGDGPAQCVHCRRSRRWRNRCDRHGDDGAGPTIVNWRRLWRAATDDGRGRRAVTAETNFTGGCVSHTHGPRRRAHGQSCREQIVPGGGHRQLKGSLTQAGRTKRCGGGRSGQSAAVRGSELRLPQPNGPNARRRSHLAATSAPPRASTSSLTLSQSGRLLLAAHTPSGFGCHSHFQPAPRLSPLHLTLRNG